MELQVEFEPLPDELPLIAAIEGGVDDALATKGAAARRASLRSAGKRSWTLVVRMYRGREHVLELPRQPFWQGRLPLQERASSE